MSLNNKKVSTRISTEKLVREQRGGEMEKKLYINKSSSKFPSPNVNPAEVSAFGTLGISLEHLKKKLMITMHGFLNTN